MSCLCKAIAGPDIELSPICLGELWMFENLPQAEVAELIREANRQKLAKGDHLFMQSDPAEELFLIKGGRVKLAKIFEDGRELTLDIRKDGDFLGENVFSDQGQYPVSAICLEDTMTCGFNKNQFEQLVLKHPTIGLQVIKNLSDRVTWLTSQVGSLAVTNIEERLHRVLCNVAKKHGTTSSQGTVIQFPLTHEDLSFLTGSHRVSITRAMKALKEAGKIILEDKRLILTAMNL
ncbi:MAG: CRP-like cAMP-binding protein [Desulforhopalus sp.]|jgi:CRP-like cAMP-binding protein